MMKKTELIARISDQNQLSKAEAKLAVEVIIDNLTQSIASGEGVEIRGFGGFYRKYRPPRIGINPKTSEKTQVGEKYVPFFKPGKLLKASLNP